MRIEGMARKKIEMIHQKGMKWMEQNFLKYERDKE